MLIAVTDKLSLISQLCNNNKQEITIEITENGSIAISSCGEFILNNMSKTLTDTKTAQEAYVSWNTDDLKLRRAAEEMRLIAEKYGLSSSQMEQISGNI